MAQFRDPRHVLLCYPPATGAVRTYNRAAGVLTGRCRSMSSSAWRRRRCSPTAMPAALACSISPATLLICPGLRIRLLAQVKLG